MISRDEIQKAADALFDAHTGQTYCAPVRDLIGLGPQDDELLAGKLA